MENVIFADVLATTSTSALRKFTENYKQKIKEETGVEPDFDECVLTNSVGTIVFDKKYEKYNEKNVEEAYMEFFNKFPIMEKGTFHIIDCGMETKQFVTFNSRKTFAKLQKINTTWETRFYPLEMDYDGELKDLIRSDRYYALSETSCMNYIKSIMLNTEHVDMQIVKITVPKIIYDNLYVNDFKHKEVECNVSNSRKKNYKRLHRYVICLETPHFSNCLLLSENKNINKLYEKFEDLFTEQNYLTNQCNNMIDLNELLSETDVVAKYNEIITSNNHTKDSEENFYCDHEEEYDEEDSEYEEDFDCEQDEEYDDEDSEYEEGEKTPFSAKNEKLAKALAPILEKAKNVVAVGQGGVTITLDSNGNVNLSGDISDVTSEEEKEETEPIILKEKNPTLYLGVTNGELKKKLLAIPDFIQYVNEGTWIKNYCEMFVENTSVFMVEAENNEGEFYAILYLNKDKKLSYFVMDNDTSKLMLFDEFESVVEIKY